MARVAVERASAPPAGKHRVEPSRKRGGRDGSAIANDDDFGGGGKSDKRSSPRRRRREGVDGRGKVQVDLAQIAAGAVLGVLSGAARWVVRTKFGRKKNRGDCDGDGEERRSSVSAAKKPVDAEKLELMKNELREAMQMLAEQRRSMDEQRRSMRMMQMENMRLKEELTRNAAEVMRRANATNAAAKTAKAEDDGGASPRGVMSLPSSRASSVSPTAAAPAAATAAATSSEPHTPTRGGGATEEEEARAPTSPEEIVDAVLDEVVETASSPEPKSSAAEDADAEADAEDEVEVEDVMPDAPDDTPGVDTWAMVPRGTPKSSDGTREGEDDFASVDGASFRSGLSGMSKISEMSTMTAVQAALTKAKFKHHMWQKIQAHR